MKLRDFPASYDKFSRVPILDGVPSGKRFLAALDMDQSSGGELRDCATNKLGTIYLPPDVPPPKINEPSIKKGRIKLLKRFKQELHKSNYTLQNTNPTTTWNRWVLGRLLSTILYILSFWEDRCWSLKCYKVNLFGVATVKLPKGESLGLFNWKFGESVHNWNFWPSDFAQVRHHFKMFRCQNLFFAQIKTAKPTKTLDIGHHRLKEIKGLGLDKSGG